MPGITQLPGAGGSGRLPQQRIVEKMDEYMSRRDYAGAERHLLYWLAEALEVKDERAELMLRGELIGHYRKMSQKEKGIEQIEKALDLIGDLGFGETISAATTYVNAATALCAFGENDRAIGLFGKAKGIYESAKGTDQRLLGGLYNNMALALAALKRFDEADEMFRKAYDAMSLVSGGEPEMAITCLNMADAVCARDGMEKGEGRIFELLDKAQELLDDPGPVRDGYYAFVCEKCAPSFSYYGYFQYAGELDERAREIYERNIKGEEQEKDR